MGNCNSNGRDICIEGHETSPSGNGPTTSIPRSGERSKQKTRESKGKGPPVKEEQSKEAKPFKKPSKKKNTEKSNGNEKPLQSVSIKVKEAKYPKPTSLIMKISEPTEADIAVDKALNDLRPYQNRPLSAGDKVLVMQGWNKALAFKTAFSEGLLIYWRIMCCDETNNNSKAADPMKLIEKNKDPLWQCLRERMSDAEELLMGVLDAAVRSLCPAHQVVQREAYRPMADEAILQRERNEFSLECESLQDHLHLLARLGVTPQFWVYFVSAVVWSMKTHAPYAQADDIDDLNQGPFNSAFGRAVALQAAIPAIQAYRDLTTLYKAPVVGQLQQIWGRFSETGRIDFGEAFYRKLLSDYPQLLDYFAKTDMDSLAVHLSMSLDLVIKNVHSLGSSAGSFRQALDSLGEVHRRMNVPTYSYALVGGTILDAFQPVFDQEEKDTKDSEDPVSAKGLRAALTKVYGEIMSIVYYPMRRQETLVAAARDFYEQLKVELEWSDAKLQRRFQQIELEIASTGAYLQTTEELEMGARLAWRNSAKCIGESRAEPETDFFDNNRNSNDLSFSQIRPNFMEHTQDPRLPSYQ
jgi:hemoglobin-like flavoprotein